MMNLSATHKLLIKNSIVSRIAFNKVHNIIACQFESIQNICFFQLINQQFVQIFNKSARPLALVNAFTWSPNGSMLALGLTKIQIWTINQNQIAHTKYFNEDFVEIRMISWSSDSSSYACIGIHKNYSILFRQVSTGELRTLSLQFLVSSVCFDPFGKYVAALLNNNTISIYTNSLELYKSVNLSNTQYKYMTVKENRGIDWSPDFSQFICPSLQDNKISLCVSISRNKNWEVKEIYLGHSSPISCVKFSSRIYEYDNEMTQIVAMGDTSGVVSVWRIGKYKKYQAPLFLAKCHPKSDQSIQQIQWNDDGQILIVNTKKLYLVLYKFKKNNFGRELTQTETAKYIQNLYGSSCATQFKNIQLKIYTPGSKQEDKIVNRITIPNQQIINHSIKNTNNIRNQKEFQWTDMKVQNKDKKKTIIPSLKIQRNNQKIPQNIVPNNINHIAQTIPKYQIKPQLKLKTLGKDIKLKNIYRVTHNTILELKNIQSNNLPVILIQLIEITDSVLNQQPKRIIKNQRAFQGSIDDLQILSQYICVFNKKTLYVFDKELSVAELPMLLGQIYSMCITQDLEVYTISVEGVVRAYSLKNRNNLGEGTIGLILEGEPQSDDPVQSMKVDNNKKLFIKLKNSKNQYFIDWGTKLWIKINFTQGKFVKGDSLRIGYKQQIANKNLFSFNPNILMNSTNLSQLEYNLVYYQKYSPNPAMYLTSLLSFIKELNNRKLDEQLRKVIDNHFFNSQSKVYIDDIGERQRVWSSVAKLNGKIIQQFKLMYQ